MEKFFVLRKFDERTGTVYGIMTAAEPDKSGEIFDYDGGGKADIQRWSAECVASTRAAGQEASLGNIRLQHDPAIIAGKAIQLDFDDNEKKVGLLSRPVNEEVMDLCRKGFVRGYSIAGDYQSRTCAVCGADMTTIRGNGCPDCGRDVLVKFVPRVVEVSYVDSPCLESAVFEYVKSDGVSILKKFAKEHEMKPKEHIKALAAMHKVSAKHELAHAGIEKQLAQHAEQRADPTGAKLHKVAADLHETMARAHDVHAEQLGAMASQAPDTWPLANQSVDTNGNPTNEKVAKAFFDEFIYGTSNRDVFGRPVPSPAPALTSPPDLFA